MNFLSLSSLARAPSTWPRPQKAKAVRRKNYETPAVGEDQV